MNQSICEGIYEGVSGADNYAFTDSIHWEYDPSQPFFRPHALFSIAGDLVYVYPDSNLIFTEVNKDIALIRYDSVESGIENLEKTREKIDALLPIPLDDLFEQAQKAARVGGLVPKNMVDWIHSGTFPNFIGTIISEDGVLHNFSIHRFIFPCGDEVCLSYMNLGNDAKLRISGPRVFDLFAQVSLLVVKQEKERYMMGK